MNQTLTLVQYFDKHLNDGYISKSTYDKILKIWDKVRKIYPNLSEPDAAVADGDTAMIAWDDGLIHFDFEFWGYKPTESFYYQYQPKEGKCVDLDVDEDADFPESIVEALEYFNNIEFKKSTDGGMATKCLAFR